MYNCVTDTLQLVANVGKLSVTVLSRGKVDTDGWRGKLAALLVRGWVTDQVFIANSDWKALFLHDLYLYFSVTAFLQRRFHVI